MEARSVKKKWNDKKFAAGVDRSVIEKGAEMLGVSLDDLITDCIMECEALQKRLVCREKFPLPTPSPWRAKSLYLF